MKTAIIYASMHHENTKKLVNAIAKEKDIDIINAIEQTKYNLKDYDLIGFASGVAFGKYYPQILDFMKNNLPEGKRVFFMHTAGSPRENHNLEALSIVNEKSCRCMGTYYCKGFDTYGPFKLIGGIRKGHPNNKDIEGAVQFFERLTKDK